MEGNIEEILAERSKNVVVLKIISVGNTTLSIAERHIIGGWMWIDIQSLVLFLT